MKKEDYIFRKVIYLDSKGKKQCQFYRYKRENTSMFALYIALKYFDIEIVSANRVSFYEMDFVLKNTKKKYIDFTLPLFCDSLSKLNVSRQFKVMDLITMGCFGEFMSMVEDYYNTSKKGL